jgi:hypothetical protein
MKEKGIVLFFEISRPFVLKGGWFNSDIMYRVWWGWFSCGWYKMSLFDSHAKIKKSIWVEKVGRV